MRPSILVVALVALALPAAASGQGGVLDANCPGPPIGQNFNDPAKTQVRFAQVFTAQASGSLIGAQAAVRKAGTAGDYRVEIAQVNHSGVPTNGVLASAVVADASVPAGDSLISVDFAPAPAVSAGERYALVVTRPGSSVLGVGVRTADDCPGALFESGSQTDQYLLTEPDLDLVFSVFVEPAADLAAPETMITRAPKPKTRKRAATFEFTSTDPGASFECSLDGGAFGPCGSPHVLKVKRGRHHFEVRSVDASGNSDGSPAAAEWKVKRKKRR